MRAQAVAIALTLLSWSAAAGPVEEANAVVAKWAATFSANDLGGILKLYAPDATLLGTVSPTLASGQEPMKAYFARLPGSGAKVIIGEHRAAALGSDAAVSVGFYNFTFIRDGKPVESQARFTFAVEKRGADWLIVHHHSSQLPKPAS